MKKRTIALLMAVVMLFGATVGTTIAWLTSLSATVTNTMTVGDVKITLDEADVNREVANSDGSKTIIYDEYVNSNNSHVDSIGDAARVTANEYKLYPGKEYDKDPTVHIDDASENCFVFVKVVNGIKEIETAHNTVLSDGTTYVSIEKQMEDNGWIPVAEGSNVYYYAGAEKETDGSVAASKDLVVFENFAIKTDVDGATLSTYKNATITIKAYAIQAEGFEDALDAWANAPTDWED